MSNSTKLLFLLLTILLSCGNQEEAQRPMNHSSKSFVKQSVERNKRIYKEQEEHFLQLFKKDSISYTTSKNGFWYQIKERNDSIPYQSITKGTIIHFDYEINDLNNTPIYPKEKFLNQKHVVEKENIISGLREGLILLKKHDIACFYLPSQKAYGFHGDNDKIGTNMALIINVKINDIYYNSK